MLDAYFAMDAWLRQQTFQPCANPRSPSDFFRNAGISAPGMTDFWYCGSYQASPPFYIKIVLLPPPSLGIIGGSVVAVRGSEKDFDNLREKARDFSGKLEAYMKSLDRAAPRHP